MSALKWIYDNRVDSYGLRVRRFGSRKFGLVANVMTGDPYLSSSAMGTSWRLHFGYGPFGGVDAGFAGADIRGHIWSLPGGRGLGLGWGPR
jgi:hypothetical protein